MCVVYQKQAKKYKNKNNKTKPFSKTFYTWYRCNDGEGRGREINNQKSKMIMGLIIYQVWQDISEGFHCLIEKRRERKKTNNLWYKNHKVFSWKPQSWFLNVRISIVLFSNLPETPSRDLSSVWYNMSIFLKLPSEPSQTEFSL